MEGVYDSERFEVHRSPAVQLTAHAKGRVEHAVPGVRDDCFAGEVLTTLDDARA
jgi:hypothetical protein